MVQIDELSAVIWGKYSFDNKMSKTENTFYIKKKKRKKKKSKLFSTFLVFWLDFIEINIYVILSHDRYSSSKLNKVQNTGN